MPEFIVPLFIIAKTYKQLKCPLIQTHTHTHTHTNTHTHTGILLSLEKEWNHAICSNMDAMRNYHTKWSKSKRKRQIPCDITYMRNLKYDTNQLFYETETDSQT